MVEHFNVNGEESYTSYIKKTLMFYRKIFKYRKYKQYSLFISQNLELWILVKKGYEHTKDA